MSIRKGGCESRRIERIQFAVNPENGDVRIIENPRVSFVGFIQATGFPYSRGAAKLAVGYT